MGLVLLFYTGCVFTDETSLSFIVYFYKIYVNYSLSNWKWYQMIWLQSGIQVQYQFHYGIFFILYKCFFIIIFFNWVSHIISWYLIWYCCHFLSMKVTCDIQVKNYRRVEIWIKHILVKVVITYSLLVVLKHNCSMDKLKIFWK